MGNNPENGEGLGIGNILRGAACLPFRFLRGFASITPANEVKIPSKYVDPHVYAAEEAKKYDNRGIGIVVIPPAFESDEYQQHRALRTDFAYYAAHFLKQQKTIGYGRHVGICSLAHNLRTARVRQTQAEFIVEMQEAINEVTERDVLIVEESKERSHALLPPAQRIGLIAEEFEAKLEPEHVQPEDRALILIMDQQELSVSMNPDRTVDAMANLVGVLVNERTDPISGKIIFPHEGADEIRELDSRRSPSL